MGVAVFVMMFACTVIAHAASGSVTFGSTSYSVEAGKEFNIGVYVKSEVNVGTYTFSITYDSDKIEYISGADAASEGILSFAGYPNSKNTKIWLTFKAKAAGTCTIAVKSPYLGPTDSAHGDSLTISKASSAPITIKGGSSTTGTTAGTAGSADLKSIWIEETGFYGFSANKTEYDITVNNELDKVTVTAKAADSNARVAISDTTLKVGANKIYIDVTCQDGTTKRYTIIVRRKQGSTTTSSSTTAPTTTPNAPTTTPSVSTSTPAGQTTPVARPDVDMTTSMFSYNNVPLYFCEGFDGVDVPDGYMVTGITVGENYQTNALVNENGTKVLLCLAEKEGAEGRLYVYVRSKEAVYPYIEIVNKGLYVIVQNADVEAPAGYEQVQMTIRDSGEEVPIIGWYNPAAENFYLVCASYNGGEAMLYQYDNQEHTIQRYNAVEPSGAVEGNTDKNEGKDNSKSEAEIDEIKAKHKSEIKTCFIIIIVLIVLCIGLAVGLFFMYNRAQERQEYADYDEEDMEYYDEEDSYDGDMNDEDGAHAKEMFFGDDERNGKRNEDEDIDENEFTFFE